jgi:quercetin dioxygenase-like cupin family protein
MRLNFTPEWVTPFGSDTSRTPLLEASAPLAPLEGAGVFLTPDIISAQVDALASAMLSMPDAQVQIAPRHIFSDGLYGREVRMPAGTIAVGHRHKQAHICIISEGRCLVVAEDGTQEVEAPATFTVPVGRRNCVHAITETVWTTIHAVPNDMRDVADIEMMLVGTTIPAIEGGNA